MKKLHEILLASAVISMLLPNESHAERYHTETTFDLLKEGENSLRNIQGGQGRLIIEMIQIRQKLDCTSLGREMVQFGQYGFSNPEFSKLLAPGCDDEYIEYLIGLYLPFMNNNDVIIIIKDAKLLSKIKSDSLKKLISRLSSEGLIEYLKFDSTIPNNIKIIIINEIQNNGISVDLAQISSLLETYKKADNAPGHKGIIEGLTKILSKVH